MNNDLRAQLDVLPVPWDGGPAAACVTYDDATRRWALAWQVGREKQPSGLTFDKPLAAIRAATYLNRRNQS